MTILNLKVFIYSVQKTIKKKGIHPIIVKQSLNTLILVKSLITISSSNKSNFLVLANQIIAITPSNLVFYKKRIV